MKKLIISTILCLGLLMPAIAQNADPTLSRRGIALLPEAGDFALGIEANPFLVYLGNFFSTDNGNKAPEFSGFDQTIYGKYFLENNRAIRAKIRFELSQSKEKTSVKDDYAVLVDPTNTAATVFDTKITNRRNVYLDLGYEFRRGKGRVQGFYGGEVYLGCGRDKIVYDYGNPITESNQTPSTTVGQTNLKKGYRAVNERGGLYLCAGVGAFVGVEYFFTPQISLGGDLGLGISYYNIGQDEYTTEEYLGTGVQEYQYRDRPSSITTPKNNATDFTAKFATRTTGAIFVMFHF